MVIIILVRAGVGQHKTGVLNGRFFAARSAAFSAIPGASSLLLYVLLLEQGGSDSS